MLLHQSPVNAARVARHQLPINSLWFWGAGTLPSAIAPRWQQVWGTEEIAQGLALHTQTAYLSLPKESHDFLAKLPHGDSLAIITPNSSELSDREQWLINLEKNWFNPLISDLRQRTLENVWIYPCHHKVFKINATHLWRWWRKPQSWQVFLSKEKD